MTYATADYSTDPRMQQAYTYQADYRDNVERGTFADLSGAVEFDSDETVVAVLSLPVGGYLVDECCAVWTRIA